MDYGVSDDRSSKLATPAIKAYNLMADRYHQVVQKRGQPLHEGFVTVKAPAGLAPVLAHTMHFVDALTRMHLVSMGQPAASVLFVYQHQKYSVLRGDAPDGLNNRPRLS